MDRRNFIKSLLGGSVASYAMAKSKRAFAYNNLHPKNGPYIDGLSFLPEDLADIKNAKVDGYVADISRIEAIELPDGRMNYKRTYKACIEGIEAARNIIEANNDKVILAKSGADVEEAMKDGKAAIFPQIQGADCIEGGFHELDDFEALGLRVLQLTHHYGNLYAGGALDKVERGLTKKGRELIPLLQKKHMLVDVSHSSPQSARDTLSIATKPLAQTHGAARAIVNHARCTPDDVLKGIGDGGGVFGVFMMSFWLTADDVPLPDHYLAQIRHVANVAGIEGVGVSNDYQLRGDIDLLALENDNFEGVKKYLPWWESLRSQCILGYEQDPKHVVIPELNNIDRMERIHALLLKAGFKTGEADKIMGKNWQRLLKSI